VLTPDGPLPVYIVDAGRAGDEATGYGTAKNRVYRLHVTTSHSAVDPAETLQDILALVAQSPS
jgi:hypothetical protein